MDEPVQVMLAPDERRTARIRAAELGLSLPDYILRTVRLDLDGWTPALERTARIPIDDAGHTTTADVRLSGEPALPMRGVGELDGPADDGPDTAAAEAEDGIDDELGPASYRNASIGEAVAARIARVDEEGRPG